MFTSVEASPRPRRLTYVKPFLLFLVALATLVADATRQSVQAQPVLSVSPTTPFVVSGPQGGPFPASTQTFIVSNTGTAAMAYTVLPIPAWTTLTGYTGFVAAGSSQTITYTVNAVANVMPAGVNTTTVTFSNNSVFPAATVPVDFTLNVAAPVPPTLAVAPTTPFTASGPQGGPFSPTSVQYTVKNDGDSPMLYTALPIPAWMTLTGYTGLVPAHSSQTLTYTVNAVANVMPVGANTTTVTFSNNSVIPAATIPIDFTLNVAAPVPPTLSLNPATPFTASGVFGGPFSPASVQYTVKNDGDSAMLYTALPIPAWTTLTGYTGLVPPRSSQTLTYTLNAVANVMPVGANKTTVTFSNNSVIPAATIPIDFTLNVLAPPAMVLTPATGLVSSGPQGQKGGAFTPTSATFTLQNTGAAPLEFTVTGAPSWVTVAPTSGTILAGGSVTVTAALNAGADALPVGVHTGTLTFTNTTNGVGTATRPVTLTIGQPAQMTVSDAAGLDSSGYQGGPFSPASKTYTLTNSGAYPLVYTVGNDQSWATVAPTSGTIPPGGSVTVTASVNPSANSLAGGVQAGTLTFTNTTTGTGNTTRPAKLTVIPNGQVILKVVTSDGDGTFKFSSSTPALAQTLTTSGGVGQTAPVTLNPGTYVATAVLPDGFGLTSVTCSNAASSGSVAAKSATVNLTSSATVTCTFSAANSRKKTAEVIGGFMKRRNDMVVSNGPDTNRQVDRLIEASGQAGAGGPSAGLNDGAGRGFGAARLGSALGSASEADIGAPIFGNALGNSSAGARRMGMDRALELGRSSDSQDNDPQNRTATRGLSPLALSGQSEGGSRYQFSTSLSQMMRYSAEAENRKVQEGLGGERMALGKGYGRPGKPHFSPVDIWAEGKIATFGEDRRGLEVEGHFGILHVGADYVVNPSFLIGVAAQFDSMRQKSAAGGYAIDGDGWMVGPYMTLRLTENVFLQARAATGTSQNAVSPYLTYTDHFRTDRRLASGTLTGRWQFGSLLFRPSASVSYIEDKSEAYTDSLGVAIPGLKVSLGQAKFGPEFAYRIAIDRGTEIEPRVALLGIWNFNSSGTAVNFGDTLAGTDEFRGKVELGLKTQFQNGISVDVSGSYDGIGSSSYHSTAGRVGLRVPLN
jgi:outer membrane autotransporter protein